MARPPKSIKTAKGHRTKNEKNLREKGEEALTPSGELKEWKRTGTNRGKSWYFKFVKRMFADVGEDSEIYSAVINRYCELLAECGALEKEASKTLGRLDELEERKSEMEYSEWLNCYIELVKASDREHKTLDRKRNMLLAIEKENLMTVMAKLRAVPKKPQEDEEESDPMAELLKGRPKLNVLK